MEKDDNTQGDIIIVRRGRDDHDDHHGGVWKIAFADFMTAMMAFFLVMWLVNASSEETKKAVASYFNPIKLTDKTTNSKGLKNPKYGIDAEDKETTEDVTTIETPAKVEIKLATEEQKFDEQALFVDPYALLAEIEGGVGSEDGQDKQFNSTDPGDGSSMNKGIEFQDPFDPNSWDNNQQIGEHENTLELPDDEVFEAEQTTGLEGSGNGTGVLEGEEVDFAEVSEEDINKEEEAEKLEEEELAQANKEPSEQLNELGDPIDQETETTTIQPEAEGEELADQKELAEEGLDDGIISDKITEAASSVKEQLEAALTESKLTGLDVDVRASSEGIIVALSDNNRNGMFTIGSARPTPLLVKTMAKLGGVVAEQSGQIEIIGHTDGRKYQSKDYDNWRLSSSRAHMAYYMLVRGGMKEERVEKIIGQADVNLKDPENPNSAINRRIEILIKPE